jgi:hypothetical protein
VSRGGSVALTNTVDYPTPLSPTCTTTARFQTTQISEKQIEPHARIKQIKNITRKSDQKMEKKRNKKNKNQKFSMICKITKILAIPATNKPKKNEKAEKKKPSATIPCC